MKVYVCEWCDNDMVVFSTQEKAEEFVKQSEAAQSWRAGGWGIFERIVDDPTGGIDKAINGP